MPEPQEGAVLMQVSYSGICGTDKHTFRGETEQYAGTEYERSTPFPIIQGHENVGVVAEITPTAAERIEFYGRRLAVGDRITMCPDVVCGRCYEVPAEMRDLAAGVQPVSATVSWTGTPAIDVAAGVVAQLRDAGVEVRWVPGCSRERDDLYSYRRNGPTGRFAGVVARSAS